MVSYHDDAIPGSDERQLRGATGVPAAVSDRVLAMSRYRASGGRVAVPVRDDGVAVSSAVETRTYGGRTAWARNLGAPVRDFLSTQTGGAAVMALATVAALVWANSQHSYESVWSTTLAVRIGGAWITADLRVWVNEGLMTVFFLVVGLEAKREFDLGELRDRRRVVIPVLAAIGGIAVPVAIYIGVNAGGPGAHGWGAAMSTDSAFALGALALLTPRSATRLRVFLLTLSVVDDLCALVVIAIVYTAHVSMVALAVAVGLFGALIAQLSVVSGHRCRAHRTT
jgi:Na+/H+ antiporter NhaA